MTFDQVEFFMSCASCLNFSLAAKYHFVSVSTLSRSISALEEELGVKLFDRGYHGHKLTEAGKDFFLLSMDTALKHNEYIRSHSKLQDDTILVGCYAFNGSFARFINCISNAPSDFVNKKIKVLFVPDGMMRIAILKGYIHIALDSSEVSEDDSVKSGLFYYNDNARYSFISLKLFDEVAFNRFCQLGNYYK